MADLNHNSLQFDGYIIKSGTMLLSEAGAEPASIRININKLVNRQDLIDRLPPEEALRLGSWHVDYMNGKNRLAISGPAGTSHYVVFDGLPGRGKSSNGEPLTQLFTDPEDAIEACKQIRGSHPAARVIQFTRFF